MDKEMHTVLHTLRDNVVQELKALNKKDTLSANEVKAGTDAMCLLIKIEEYKRMLSGDEEEMMDYSMSGRPRMNGTMRSNVSYGENYNMAMYDGMRDTSYDRGRSPVTGKYISRDSGYSSHSINDRMIAKFESMYDEAKSDYDREEIRKEIDRLRNRSN